jgi:hypothetical protein
MPRERASEKSHDIVLSDSPLSVKASDAGDEAGQHSAEIVSRAVDRLLRA